MTMREMLENELYNKASDEQTAFKAELRTKTPDEVMDNAYRLVMQEDILMIFDEPACLSDREIRALLKLEHVLESCYNDWLKNDLSHKSLVLISVSYE